jgi:hypothetical protein
MSLINEALKRTQNAQQQTAPAAGGPVLRPVDAAQTKTARGARALLFIMVLAVILGNLLLWMAFNDRGGQHQVPTTPEVRAKSVPPPEPAAQPPVELVSLETAVVSTPAQPESIPAAAVPPEVVAETPAVSAVTNAAEPQPKIVFAEPPKPTVLRLQSIIYGARPSAMIAGKFLFVGDSIQGHQVVAIDKETVTLVGEGQTNTLSLP